MYFFKGMTKFYSYFFFKKAMYVYIKLQNFKYVIKTSSTKEVNEFKLKIWVKKCYETDKFIVILYKV